MGYRIDENGQKWTEVDTRQRFEKSSPMHFSGEGRSESELEAYRRGFDAIDWSAGRPNQAKTRKALPEPKMHRRIG